MTGVCPMQFNEKDVSYMLKACEHYKNLHPEPEYDIVIKKLHNYEEEYDCPGCWDPASEHTCRV